MDVVSSHDLRSLVRRTKEVEPELLCAGRVEKGQKHPVSNRGRRHTEHVVDDKCHESRFLIQAETLANTKVEITGRLEFQSLMIYGRVQLSRSREL